MLYRQPGGLFIVSVTRKYSLFPIEHHKLWDLYKKQSQAFWLPEEIDLANDLDDFNRLNKNEKHFVKHVLAFFNESDGIVNENLVLRFYNEVDIPEARAFYAMQMGIEAVHAETYSLLLDTYIRDTGEKHKLFNAIANIPTIAKKASWAQKWITSNESFADRLFAFAIVEGLFFSGSFAAIYWLRNRGLMPGLSKANDFIARDEGLHWTFAAALAESLNHHGDNEQKKQKIIKEATEIENWFITEALPVDLIGMNSKLMSQYIRYTADRILKAFHAKPIFHAECPFDFMNLLDMQAKGNFFEVRVSEYKKGYDTTLEFAADF